jgi:hypothetical protein
MLWSAAIVAATRWRPHRVAVEPFDETAGECAGLGFGPPYPAIEFGDAGAFVEERQPVLGQPAVI